MGISESEIMWFCWLLQAKTFSAHWSDSQLSVKQPMKVSSSNSEVMVLNRKMVECSLRVGNEFLLQVEEWKYLGILFMSDGTLE